MLLPTLFLAACTTTTLFVSAAPNSPLLSSRQTAADICSSGSPYCCQLDVLGIADVTCVDPPGNPADVTAFNAVCQESGTSAECCVLGDILTLALICSSPQ